MEMDAELNGQFSELQLDEMDEIIDSINVKGGVRSIDHDNGIVEIVFSVTDVIALNRNAMLEYVQPENMNIYAMYEGRDTTYRVVLKKRNKWTREADQDEQMADMAIDEVGAL